MKILHTVEYYHPSVGGMQEHVRQISERLCRMGHRVTVATSRMAEREKQEHNGVRIVEFAVDGNAVRGMTGEVEAYRRFLLQSDFDLITNFAAQQWATDIALQHLEQIKARKVFVPTGFSGLYLPEHKDYFESMRSWLHRYDMNIFLSDDYRDINFARAVGVAKKVVIPNGAAADEFLSKPDFDVRRKLGIPGDSFFILHVGTHTGIKGHAEAIAIFRRAKIKKATLLIVGNISSVHCYRRCQRQKRFFNLGPMRLVDGKRIIVAGLSRKETVAAYHAADLFLFPSNVECSPLVLFECMASRTPFLTTDVGNAAEIIKWSGGGLVLPTLKDDHGYSRAEIGTGAEMLEKIYHDPEKRSAMSEAGFQAWRDRFTWEKIARNYEAVYCGLLGA